MSCGSTLIPTNGHAKRAGGHKIDATLSRDEPPDTLSLRKLSGEDVLSSYLDLRSSILMGELKWTTAAVQSPIDLLDEYDEHSSSFGIFLNSKLIAGIRLILSKNLKDLPSARFLDKRTVRWGRGEFAEISRGLVAPEFRHLGLLTVLIRQCLAEACNLGVWNVIASVRDTPDARGLMALLGFSLVCDGFTYHDRVIQPSGKSALMRLDPKHSLHLTDAKSLMSYIQTDLEGLGQMIRQQPRQATGGNT